MTTKIYKNRILIKKTVFAALCLALVWFLPMLTGSIPEIGGMLCPMHIPAFLLGVLVGPFFGCAVAYASPLLRGLIFGSPTLFPRGVAMAFELAAYALIFGLLYKLLPKKIGYTYLALIGAMLSGRLVGAAVKLFLYTLGSINQFGWQIFITSYFVETLPGVIIQLIIIPPLLSALRRSKIINE